MKIGIITLHSAHNFGATLQSYALQTILKKMGFEVEIINYRYNKIDRIYNPYRRSKKSFFDIKFYLSRLKLHILDRYKIRKYNKYELFIKQYFNLTSQYKTFKQLINSKWDHDAYICGSDQIWNSYTTRGLRPEYFLDFLPKGIKKISYAASIGEDKINEFDRLIFNQYLNSIDYISIREKLSLESLKKSTTKDIEVTLDPTLLLDKKDYDKLKTEVTFKHKEYIFVYVIDENKELYNIAEKISKEKNLPIVFLSPYLNSKKIFKRQMGSIEDAGPKELLGILANAKYVVTNSFHGNIFSIIYKKKFISTPHRVTSARVLELLKNFNLNHCMFTDSNEFNSIDDIEIDFFDVENRLKELKKNSINFLRNSIYNKKNSNKINYLDNNNYSFACYGCYACKEICPKNAIRMVEDFEGFVYPKINENLCNNCNNCQINCIYSNNEIIEKNKENNLSYPQIFAAFNNDFHERFNSSSGGIFPLLAENILKENGYVIGVAYDEYMEAKYMVAETLEECKKFIGSKYVRSNIENIFPKIKQLLDDNKKVLFSGIPCHTAGLKTYIGHNENLFIVELLCHSNPSPKVFKKYVSHLEKKFDQKIVNFKFKNKSNGWNKPSLEIIFESNESLVVTGRNNNYNRAFQLGLIARPSCYNCEFVKENRVGDITIGDFWGIEKFEPTWNDDKGTSLVIINNDKGNQLLEKIKSDLVISPKTLDEAFAKNHDWPIIMKRGRNKFFSRIDDENIDDLLYSFVGSNLYK